MVLSELPSGPHLKLNFYTQLVLFAAKTDTNCHNAHNAGVILFFTDRMSRQRVRQRYVTVAKRRWDRVLKALGK